MPSAPHVVFAPFRVDLANEQLWRGDTPIPLRRQTFAVLRYMIEHAGQVVSKAALLDALWPGIYVTDLAPMICIGELRKALGDDARAPRFIETVHRRGYRWIAPLTSAPSVQGSRFKVQGSKSEPAPNPQPPTPSLVGRDAELEQLHRWLEKALRGERQVVFVTGEAGIGKTTLTEAFLEQVAATGELWIGRGQCVEHYGASEPYMPVLEAFGRLGRTPDGERLIAVLRQYAPTWLVHLPTLLSPAEREQLQREAQGVTPQRMLREIAEAVEAITAERGLILKLEDVHWSDVSSLTWLAFLARRRERARVLVLSTYRPAEVLGDGHPLRAVTQELQVHRQGAELRLGALSEAAVREYVTQRLAVGMPGRVLLQPLARAIHQRTEGNPLFMVNVVEALVARAGGSEEEEQGPLRLLPEAVQTVVPVDLRQMIERQIERLSPKEQHVLEAASVAGAEFAAAAVAAGVEAAVREVEGCCAGLARRELFVQACGSSEWPDGTVSARYRFLHALYQEELYERVTPGWRVELHRRIGERAERAYGQRTQEIAAELAVHFERGRDTRRAVQYLGQAGENASRRSAHVEAINLLTKGLELLKPLPDTPERLQQELALQIALGVSLALTRGYAAPEVEKTYTRALDLCRQVGETPQLFRVLRGLWVFYEVRAEYQTARELAEQCLTLAQRAQDLPLLLEARLALGQTLYYLGELAPAREHWEQGIALYDPQQHSSHAFRSPVMFCLQLAAFALWHLGYPEQALKRVHGALTLAQEMDHPFSLAFTLDSAAQLHQYRREDPAAQERAEAAMTLATEQGFALPLAVGMVVRGWALTEQGHKEEGIAQLQEGLAACQAIGAKTLLPYFLALLAEAYGKVGRAKEGLTTLAEALATVNKTGERWYEAELYRLKGDLSLQSEVRSPKSEVRSPKSLTPDL